MSSHRIDTTSVLARAGYTVTTTVQQPLAAQTSSHSARSAPKALTAAAVVRHAQRSGATEGWLQEMEQAVRAESYGESDGPDSLLPPDASAAAVAAMQPSASSGDDAPLCPLERRLLARMLSSAEADPSLRALLRDAEGGDAHGRASAQPSLHDLVRRAGQLCARTILDQPAAPPSAAHSSRARATHPSSVLPELHERCAAAYRAVAQAQPQPSDPAHPASWTGAEGETVRAAVGAPLLDSRADRLLSATAEDLLLHMQNERST